MTQPQPPPSKASQANLNTLNTLDNHTKLRLLQQLLHDIPVPKTARASCSVPLKDLQNARVLIDAILQEDQQPSPFTALCAKLDDIATQVQELRKTEPLHTLRPPTPPHAEAKNHQTPHHAEQKTYAAATATYRNTPVSPTREQSKSEDAELPAKRAQPLPAHTAQPKRVIMRFTNSIPTHPERMSPQDMRDAVNEAISRTYVQISGAQFTQAGHIALTPQAPHTAEQLLRLSNIFGSHIAHGQPIEWVVFELDKAWHSVVIGGVQSPRGRTVLMVEETLQEEMLEWNPVLRKNVKSLRLLCRKDDIWEKERGSMLVSFEERGDFERAIQDGVYMFGEHCQATPYKPRRKSSSRSTTGEIRPSYDSRLNY
jgi:hypothetical protein